MSTLTSPRTVAPRAAVSQVRGGKPAMLATSIDPIRVLRRHVLGILLAGIAGTVFGVGAYFALKTVYPLYSAEVRFEVQPGLQQAGQVGAIDTADDNMVFRIAQTESYMLTTRDVLTSAIQNNPDIRQTDWHKQFLQPNSDGQMVINYDEAIDDLEEDLRPNVLRSSNLFGLAWHAHVPNDVPIVLNAIAKAYMNNRRARDNAVYQENLRVFTNQMADIESAMDALASEMRRLIERTGMTELDGVWRSAQAFKMQQLTEQLGDMTTFLSVSQTQEQQTKDKIEGKLEYSSDDVYQAEHDPAVMNEIQRLQGMKAELRRLLSSRLPDDPMVVDWEQSVAATEAQIDSKVRDIILRDLDAKYKTYGQDVEKYRTTVEKFEAELEENRENLQALAVDQSDYEAMKTRRENLEAQRTASLQLINEVKLIQLRVDAARVREAQRALPPRELSFPKPEIIIPLGALVVLGLTVGLIFLRELMDQRVKSVSDVAVLPGAHVLGGIPELEEDPTNIADAELVVRKHPMSVLSESYRQAATSILPVMDRNGHQTLLLVAGLPGSGTTTVATNLAATAAAAGKKVLAIDANFRRPRLAEAMGVRDDGPGLGDLLVGGDLDSAIVDVGDGIHVVPAGTLVNRVFDRISNGTFDGVMADLRGRYDLIIFDAPPAVVCGDAMVLANKVDATVLVVRAHQEHRGLVARMIHRLADSRSELLGVLLNRPRGIAGGYLKKNYATMAQYTERQ